MRTNIIIDDGLMNCVLKLTGFTTKREVFDAGLKLLEQLKRQEQLRGARGKLRWEGDLDAMRKDM